MTYLWRREEFQGYFLILNQSPALVNAVGDWVLDKFLLKILDQCEWRWLSAWGGRALSVKATSGRWYWTWFHITNSHNCWSIGSFWHVLVFMNPCCSFIDKVNIFVTWLFKSLKSKGHSDRLVKRDFCSIRFCSISHSGYVGGSLY